MRDEELFGDLPAQQAPPRRRGAPRLLTPERDQVALRAVYKLRSRHERINADLRRRGLTRLTVRGKAQVRIVLLWHALAHNLMRCLTLRRTVSAAA